VSLEPQAVGAVESRAGRPVVVEPQAAVELVVELRGAVVMAARAGPPEAVEVVESRGAAGGAARPAWGTLPAVVAAGAGPSEEPLPGAACHSIRRIYFQEERTCDTSGT